MTLTGKRLLLIGCGRMGGALLQGWESKALGLGVTVADPNPALSDEQRRRVDCYDRVAVIPEDYRPDIVLFAVKPQMAEAILDDCISRGWNDALWCSVAAGKKIDFFSARLGENAPIVRVMPNTPALIGCGMAGLVAGKQVSDNQRQQVTELMEAVGKAVWLEQETQLDAFTALAGSGPAYIFHMIEAMTAAGTALGLSDEVAALSAMQTVYGAAKLAHDSDDSPTTLREQVTSPNGTTQAALDVLMDASDGLPPLMLRALTAASDRSQELG